MEKTGLYGLISKYRQELMGIAALMILTFHVCEPLQQNTAPFYFLEVLIIQSNYMGVEIFLFVSGMGMVHAISKAKGLGEFYLRRVKRLIVPYVLVSILRSIYLKMTFTRALYVASGLGFFFENVYTTLWFVPAIACMYLFFPLYNSILKKFKGFKQQALFTGAFIVLWMGITGTFVPQSREDLFCFLDRVIVFVIGVLFGTLAQKTDDIKINRYGIYVAILVYLGGMVLFLRTFQGELTLPIQPLYELRNLCVSLPLIYIIPIALNAIKNKKTLTIILRSMGKISLELYCAQVVIQEIFQDKFIESMPVLASNLSLVILSIALGYVFYLINKTICSKIKV